MGQERQPEEEEAQEAAGVCKGNSPEHWIRGQRGNTAGGLYKMVLVDGVCKCISEDISNTVSAKAEEYCPCMQVAVMYVGMMRAVEAVLRLLLLCCPSHLHCCVQPASSHVLHLSVGLPVAAAAAAGVQHIQSPVHLPPAAACQQVEHNTQWHVLSVWCLDKLPVLLLPIALSSIAAC
jgi:hypothetical protein